MLQCRKYITLSTSLLKYCYKPRYFSSSIVRLYITRPTFKEQSKKQDIGPIGWFLLLIPTTTFGLGTWQIQRKKWKENLIADLESKSSARPVPLPEDLLELKSLEYYPVYVRGHFLHDKELYMGPRSLLKDGDAASKSGLLSKNQNKNIGYLVVTPFKLADRDLTILINRGWVPSQYKNPHTRKEGQISNEVGLVGIVRLKENRPNFIPNNNPTQNSWFYRDLDKMAQVTDAEPVFLDAISDFDVPGGPIGGQTRISLRNDHLSYILTWYGLCAATSLMWYRQFLLKLPPI